MKFRVSHVFCVCADRQGFWFRVFGRGLSVAIDRPKLFSERIGRRKVWRIGRMSLEILK